MNDAFLWAEEDAPVADVEEWATLMSLSKRADPDGCNAYQSYPTIAERAKIDAKTVYRRCKEMERRGILKRGDQRAVAHIPADQRPVVWDIQIPYSWFPNIARVNRWRGEHGKPPLAPEDRPDLGPAPEKKRRADAGKPRPKKAAPGGGTSSPVAGGLVVQSPESGESGVSTGLQVPPDSESSRDWTTSPTTTLGVTHSSSVTGDTSPPPNPHTGDEQPAGKTPEEKNTPDSSKIENQEWKNFWPELTAWEQALFDECMAIRPAWSPRLLRKTLGWPTIRERTALNPELVRRAFLIGANCHYNPSTGEKGTASPKRLLSEFCPHWEQAARQLTAEQQPPEPDVDHAEQEPASTRARVARRVPQPPVAEVPPASPESSRSCRDVLAEIAQKREAQRAAEERAAEERRQRREAEERAVLEAAR